MLDLACENNRQLATLPLVSPPNDVWETSTEILYWSVADPGEEPRGAGPPLLLGQTEARRAEKFFWRPLPPLSKGLDDRPPLLSQGLDPALLMTFHYPDLGSAPDWLNQISHAARPIRSTTQIWVVTRYQYGISALVSQTSFRGETSGGVEKCRLFSQAMLDLVLSLIIQQEEPLEWHPSRVTRTRIRVNG